MTHVRRSLRVSKIVARTKTRVNASGRRIVDTSTSADHGDYINAVLKEGVWCMRHPDVQTQQEMRHNSEMFNCAQTKQALLEAAAKFHGLDVLLMDMTLMSAHLHREMIMTLHGLDDTHTRYMERCRVYDPTALTFKEIHGSLFMGEDDDSAGHARWTPSQIYLLIGCREHLFRYLHAGLRYIDSNEAHLEHRHAIRKAYIDICALHHFGLLPSQQQDNNLTDDSTHDNVVRSQLIKSMRIQLARLVHASNLALRKTSLFSKYKKQFMHISADANISAVDLPEHAHEGVEEAHEENGDDVDNMNEAQEDQFLSDERIAEMGLQRLIEKSLSRPDPGVS